MVATNTLKRQAVDNKTPLGVWLGDASLRTRVMRCAS